MTFITRKLKVIFENSESAGSELIEIVDHRVMAQIQTSGQMNLQEATLQIFGLPPSLMAELSVSQMPQQSRNRITVRVYAGIDAGGYALCYEGAVYIAYADYTNAPDVFLLVVAKTGSSSQFMGQAPMHFPGTVDAAVILQQYATLMSLGFENLTPVHVMLSGFQATGGYRDQAEKCVTDAGILWNNCTCGVLAIWPQDGFRVGNVPILSATSGMVGYPTYTNVGIAVDTLYNPDIHNGGLIRVESTAKHNQVNLDGYWQVNIMEHNLSSLIPGGPWFTRISANRNGNVTR